MALSAADLPAIYALLTNSTSGVRKPAEDALAQFESGPGFCSGLMEVITAKDLSAQVDVRLMASVYFKNSVNRCWRNRHDSLGISNEEKVYLKQKLLTHLREENYQIAAKLTVLISQIARFDYPKKWEQQRRQVGTLPPQGLNDSSVISSLDVPEGNQSSWKFSLQLKLSDPLNQLSLESSVRDNLQTCASIHGESFNSAINRMHPSALSQLKQALKML